MHIGLVGGIGPAATDYYYRRLITISAALDMPLELTIVHADAPTLLRNLDQDDKEAQVQIFSSLTERLQAAGAEAVAITSIAGHFCIEEFKEVSQLPVIDLLRETNSVIGEIGLEKVGILGTQKVMETRFYGGIASVEVIPPSGFDLAEVHRCYVAMATSGSVTEKQREIFFAVSRRLINDHGAEAIMLGGTDLVLAFDGRKCGFEVIDCAKIHIDAIAKVATD